MLVTVSGPPGAGTTTVARLVARALELELVPGGEVFRALAAEARMTLAEFGQHAAANPDVDRELDRRLEARARDGHCVLESRLAGWLASRAALPAVRVLLIGDEQVRAARVARRDGIAVERAVAESRERGRLERARYHAVYGIDPEDHAFYDLVIDSTDRTPEDLTAEIVAESRRRFAAP